MKKVINEASTAEIVVDKSRFMALLLPLKSIESFNVIYEEIKKENKGAAHFPYAYRYLTFERASDDGEPQNSAGLPLLNLLKLNDLDEVLLVVVRYFGGTKLGAGRLLRTFVEAANSAIKSATLYTKIAAYRYLLKVAIKDYDKTNYYFDKQGFSIIERTFYGDYVTISLIIDQKDAQKIESNYNILKREDDSLLKGI